MKCYVGNKEWADGDIRLYLTTYSLIGVTYAGDISPALSASVYLLQFTAIIALNAF